jgi:hypothetical protein
MGKYDPLSDYLRNETGGEIFLTFRQIERIIAGHLPDGAMKSWWWVPSVGSGQGSIQSQAWRSAGYDAQLHAGRKVKFTRAH